MSTSHEMDEYMPVVVGHEGDYILISLEEFDSYLTIFEKLLEDMEKGVGPDLQMGYTSGAAGRLASIESYGERLFDVLRVHED